MVFSASESSLLISPGYRTPAPATMQPTQPIPMFAGITLLVVGILGAGQQRIGNRSRSFAVRPNELWAISSRLALPKGGIVTIERTEEQSYATPPPVASFPELLPLDDPNLPWERFEAFCEELISRLPGVRETHRYGRRGSPQKGIDIIADLDNGERWAFQCRQWKKFTKTDATRAIQKTSYKADRFILTLSSQATSGVRDACDSDPSWDVWDVGDISRKVRELAMHSGARLVEAHFGPAWRRAFLGLQGLTSFVTPAEFFRPFSNVLALFNHTWQLIGRSDHLRQAHEFVASGQQKVAILVGRGGIGKSKILHSFAETFDGKHVGISLWFTAEGVPLTPDGADHLPFEPCVIVVDDAHRRADLPALLALSRQRPHMTKLLLSCRPQSLDFMRSQLTQGGFDVHEIIDLPDVKELSREEVTQLGRQALGPEFADLAEQLAAATWDCPLVTVVGGQLLSKKAIAADLLERDEEFQNTVLARFGDIILGEVADRIDTTLCRSLLTLIAAVQPIRLDNQRSLDVEAEFLGISRPKLLSSLGVLEEAGVLLRRGNTLRIVPDVLADHVLHHASVTPQGQTTGYADLVFDKFRPLCPHEVMRNLSELDWRLRRSGALASDLLSGVWQRIEQDFQEASNSGRCTILRMLEKVAVYQPEKTLEVVEYAIRNPATKSEDPEWSRLYEHTHSDVLRQLPTLLHQVSYTLEYLPRCCTLLWELGRDDDRNLNSHPDHAIRVLADMGSYGIGKPFVVTDGVLDAMERLLEAPDVHEHVHSPLEVIDPMLAKTGFSAHSQGHQFAYRTFALEEDKIRSIRQRAICLVVKCLSSNSLKVSLQALKSLEDALREPRPAFDLNISDEDREQWRPEQLEILTHIADFAQLSTESVVLLSIGRILWWHRRFSPSDETKDRAESITSAIPESFELRLTRELMGPYHVKDWPLEEGTEDDESGPRQEQIYRRQRALVSEFLAHSEDAGKAYETLADRIETMNDAGIQSNPQVVLGILGDTDPGFAAELCNIIADDPDGPLGPYLHPLLFHVRMWNPERAHGIAQRALRGGSNVLCRAAALSYESRGWADNATAEDIEIIKRLLDHEDIGVRRLAIGSLGTLAEARQRLAIDLAIGVEVGDSVVLAMELCELFYGRWGVPFEEVTTADFDALLSKLEDVQDIDEHYIKAFLGRASELDAEAVVGLLLNRIRRRRNEETRYSPLPHGGFQDPPIDLTKCPDQETILREVRDASLEPGWHFNYWIPQLFREISSGFESATSLKVLDEWIDSGNADRITAAAHLLSEARPEFVFKHIGFVTNLLERAQAASYDCYQSVSSSLASSAQSGGRTGTLGEPMPQDVALRDQASAVANQFDAGSPTSRFYSSLAEYAEASIKNQLLRDEELLE